MAEPIGGLRVELTANYAEFKKDIDAARRAVANATSGITRSLNSVRSVASGISNAIFSFKGALLALGAGAALRGIVTTTSEFQRLNAALETVTGSTEAATAAFEEIKEFAATTPFDLQQVTSAFIKLKALGLDPSMAALQSYGNTASAMGMELNQFIEAVADAATGEFERLKEFGIKASSEGDKVTFTFKQVATTVGKNATEIEAYLRNIGETDFAGGMERQSATLGGALNNLGDVISTLANDVGEGGFADEIEKTARMMSATGSEAKDFAHALGYILGRAVARVRDLFIFASQKAEEFADVMSGFTGDLIPDEFISTDKIKGRIDEIEAELLRLADLPRTSFKSLMAGNLFDHISGDTPEIVVDEIRNLRIRLGELYAELDKRSLAEKDSSMATAENAAATAETGNVASKTKDKIGELRRELEFEREQLNRGTIDQELYSLAKSKDIEVTQAYVDTIRPLIAALEAEKDAKEKSAEAEKALIEGREERLSRAQSITESVRTATEIYTDAIRELQVLLRAGALDQETFNRAVDEAKEKLKDASDETKKQTDLVKDLGNTWTSAFEDAIAKSGDLSDVLRGLEQDLLRIASRQFTQPLFSSIFEAINPFGKSPVVAPTNLASFGVSDSLGGISAPGTGGLYARGGSHLGGFRMVGEEGPEIEATGPARYYSAGRTADLLTGGNGGDANVQVNIYPPSGSNPETRETQGPGGRSVDVFIDESVARAIRQPGTRTDRALALRGIGQPLTGR